VEFSLFPVHQQKDMRQSIQWPRQLLQCSSSSRSISQLQQGVVSCPTLLRTELQSGSSINRHRRIIMLLPPPPPLS